MPDLKRTIEILSQYRNHAFGDKEDMVTVNDIIAMLRANEPRVMTLEEVEAQEHTDAVVYVENRKKAYYNEMAFVGTINRMSGMDETICFGGQKSQFIKGAADYGKEWRCWTSRPSDEQMKAVKWDG